MRTITITTRTGDEIKAAVANAFRDMVPQESTRRPTQADRVEPYRKEILRLRERGYSWQQIVTGFASPSVGEKFSVRLLKRVLAPNEVRATKPRSRPEAFSDQLLIDPLTGKEIKPS